MTADSPRRSFVEDFFFQRKPLNIEQTLKEPLKNPLPPLFFFQERIDYLNKCWI